jgi:hypothetical protein
MTSLTNRIALVTGASRGIGKSIALALAEAGADIAVNFNSNAAAAESVCQDIRAKGRRALPVQADVSKTQDVDRLISSIEKNSARPRSSSTTLASPKCSPPRRSPKQSSSVSSASISPPCPRHPARHTRPARRPLGTHHQPLFHRSPDGRHHRPTLRRLQGRYPGPNAFLRLAPRQRRHHGQRHRPGSNRNRHGRWLLRRRPRQNPQRSSRRPRRGGPTRRPACPKSPYHRPNHQHQRRPLHVLIDRLL